MRLNGWQRLWVVVSGCWLAVVAVVAWAAWPVPSQVSVPEVFERVDPELRSRFDISGSAAAFARRLGGRVVPLEPAKPITDEQGNPLPPGPIVDISDHVLQFVPGLTGPEMTTAAAAYDDALQQVTAQKRRRAFGVALAVWLAPVMVVYVLGAAVAWVRRGFLV